MAEQRTRELYDQFRLYLEFLYRLLPRWWVVLAGTFAGGALAVTLALLLPRYYQSRALINWQEGVSQQRVFSPGEASGADWTSLQGRLASLTSSDTRLRALIRELDLYPGERRSMPEARVLERMREAIRYDSLGGTAFWISFEYPDRYRAQAVAARLVHDFIEENVGNALSSALGIRDFMEKEVKAARRQVEAIDHAMARFVSDHPEFQTDPRTGMLRGRSVLAPDGRTGLRRRIRADTPELRLALRQKGQLEARLRLAESGQGESGQAASSLAQLQQQVSAARRALAIKRQRYTEAHPDVQAAQAFLQQVQGQLRAAQDSRRSQVAAAQQTREQLAALDRRIAELTRPPPSPRGPHTAARKYSGRGPAGTRLSSSAQLEKRWYELTRDRTVQKARLDLLQERLIKARMAADLEKQRALTQFEIIDPPNLPQRPLRPSRTKLAVGGTLLGFLLGLGLAGLMVILDQRVYSREDVSRACDVPVLAVVPRSNAA